MNNETKRLCKKYSHNHIISASLSDFNRKTLFTTIPFFQESVDNIHHSLPTTNDSYHVFVAHKGIGSCLVFASKCLHLLVFYKP